MIWEYLRRRVRDTILAGLGDALVEIEGEKAADYGEARLLLRHRLQEMLPAPEMVPAAPVVAKDRKPTPGSPPGPSKDR